MRDKYNLKANRLFKKKGFHKQLTFIGAIYPSIYLGFMFLYFISVVEGYVLMRELLSLHLPRLRHQAHKELYAYKQVRIPLH